MDAKVQMKDETASVKVAIVQILLAVLANLPNLLAGMVTSFTSVALPVMMGPNSPLQVDAEQASWIASLATIAIPAGTLVVGPLVDRCGRRAGMMVSNFPFLVGSLLISVRPSLPRIYVGRLLSGLAVGMATFPSTVYIGEVTTGQLRGQLLLGCSFMYSVAVVLTAIMGIFLQEEWYYLTYTIAAISVLTLVLIFTVVPESPCWLLLQDRYKEALQSLQMLRVARGFPDLVRPELDRMALDCHEHKAAQVEESVLSALVRPEAYKPMLIIFCFISLLSLTGVTNVAYYTVDVCEKAGGYLDAYVMTFHLSVVRLVATLAASYISTSWGRRPCAILSAVGMTLSMAALALQLYIKGSAVETVVHLSGTNVTGSELYAISPQDIYASVSWLPDVALLLFYTFAALGVLSLSFSMMGELFPVRVRGVASSLAITGGYLVGFATVKYYPALTELFPGFQLFLLCSTMSFLNLLFVAIFLPETKGRTLVDVERYFAKPKKMESVIKVRMLRRS